MSTIADPISAYRAELRAAAERRVQARRRRLLISVAAVVTGVVTGSLAIAATTEGWLTGEPAPPTVVEGFRQYTPQLGFHPQAGKGTVRRAGRADQALRDGEPRGRDLLPRGRAVEACERRRRWDVRESRQGGGPDQRRAAGRIRGSLGHRRASRRRARRLDLLHDTRRRTDREAVGSGRLLRRSGRVARALSEEGLGSAVRCSGRQRREACRVADRAPPHRSRREGARARVRWIRNPAGIRLAAPRRRFAVAVESSSQIRAKGHLAAWGRRR
jgi:hypothetical protein